MKDKMVTLNDISFTRLTFTGKTIHPLVYDARGIEFVHYPTTGNILTEKKELIDHNIHPLFDFYNDGWDKFFAFYTDDCFDPPMKLICARTWEEAYEIYCDEFADAVTAEEEEELLQDLREQFVRVLHKNPDPPHPGFDITQETPAEYIERIRKEDASLAKQIDDYATNNYGAGGQIDFMSSPRKGAETGAVWSENINGFELELLKAEVLP